MKPPRLPLLALVPVLLTSFARGQCQDPVPPARGFPTKLEPDKSVEFSDGYKTRADALYPVTRPGSCGWPLAILVHGLIGSRKDDAGEALTLAQRGFFVLRYDVRGQGASILLNPNRGSKLWALDEWIDLAEMIEWTEKTWQSVVDTDRVAVFGNSQGGIHAWAAAAYSGRKLPPNARRSAAFPKIACVVPRFFGPDLVRFVTPDETSFHWHLPAMAYTESSPLLRIDAAFRAALAKALDRDDPRAVAALLRATPGKDFLQELETTQVPVLAIQGWQDPWTDTRCVIQALASMPQATPKRLYLTTGLHGTPQNELQGLRQLLLTESWLERFLKGKFEPIEKGPPYLTASIPADAPTYGSIRSLWRHRADSTWPPADTRAVRYYLRGNNTLTSAKPAADEGSDRIRNIVRGGYGPRQYQADGGALSEVLSRIPLSSVAFETAPLTQASEFAGTPQVSLAARPDHARFLLAARLCSVSPAKETQVLARGSCGVMQPNGPRPDRVEIRLFPVASVVPAGYRLRLEVRNLDIEKPFHVESFRRLPFFHTYRVDIDHHATSPSWLELRMRPDVRADAATTDETLEVSVPGRRRFEIRSAPAWRNAIYIMFLGLSGQGPPQFLPNGSTLWLVPDVATHTFALAINRPILANFAGLLDATGSATCTMDLGLIAPLPSSLVGSYLHLAPLLFVQGDGWHAGTPLRIRFR